MHPKIAEARMKTIASNALAAALASLVTVIALAQGGPGGLRQTELFKTTMNDVSGRVLSLRVLERDAGTGSLPHRHPGSHTVGYVLEGVYETQIGDGPLKKLGPGEVFYEAPNALHAVSRNGSTTRPVKVLVVQVSDPSKPATVQEP